MSDIAFHCPRCDGHLVVDAAGAGTEAACPFCGETVTIPAPDRSRHGHARLGKPQPIVMTARGDGGRPAPHLAPAEQPAGQKRCAGCGSMVPEEARTCPECLHEFPPPRHSAEPLHVRGDARVAVPAAGSRTGTIGRHAVAATCPKCRSRIFIACGECGRTDAFRMESDCVRCRCGSATDEVDCPRCGAVVSRRHYRVHFEALSGIAEDQIGRED